LFDTATATGRGKLQGHADEILAAAFAPDGKTLVSASLDTTAVVWDVSRYTRRPARAGEPAAAELEASWQDLARDGLTAYRAVGRLAETPQATVAFLRERLKPTAAADARRVERLIADLDGKEFKTRDAASRELEALGEPVVAALQKALAGAEALEQRRRLEALLDSLERVSLAPAALRQARAVEALEAIGSAEARALLAALAGGAPEVRQTREAQAALQRLKAR
jgi:hypothetical protein